MISKKRKIHILIVITISCLLLFFFILQNLFKMEKLSDEVYQKDIPVKIQGTNNLWITGKSVKLIPYTELQRLTKEHETVNRDNRNSRMESVGIIAEVLIENRGKSVEGAPLFQFSINGNGFFNYIEYRGIFSKIYEENGKYNGDILENLNFEPNKSKIVYMTSSFHTSQVPMDIWNKLEKEDVYLTISLYPSHSRIKLK